MEKRPYVAALGHITADSYYQCLQDIVVGDKFFVRYLETLPGGMVANAASVLGALGTPTYMLGALGRDDHTGMLLDSFAPYGVDTGGVDVLPGVRNFATSILVSPGGGDRTIMLHENLEKPVLRMDDHKRKVLLGASCLYALACDLRTIDGYEGLLDELRERGVRLMLDAECSTFTSADTPEDRYFFHRADIISFNDAAVAQYCGEAGEDALYRLVGDSDKVVLVTLGKRGCRVYTRDGREEVPGCDLCAVDTTGAGDTFNAAYLHAALRGKPPAQAARFATAAAGRSVLYRGARSGAVPEAEVLRFQLEQAAASSTR